MFDITRPESELKTVPSKTVPLLSISDVENDDKHREILKQKIWSDDEQETIRTNPDSTHNCDRQSLSTQFEHIAGESPDLKIKWPMAKSNQINDLISKDLMNFGLKFLIDF